MRWLLRLFPQYAEAQARIVALEEKCRMLEHQAHMADARVEDLRKVADATWRYSTGRSVFGGMTDITPPEVEAPRPVMGNRKLGREMQMDSTARFFRDLLGSDQVA